MNFGIVAIMCSQSFLFGTEIGKFQINPEGWLVGVWDGDSWDLSQQFQTSSRHNPNRRCSIKLPCWLIPNVFSCSFCGGACLFWIHINMINSALKARQASLYFMMKLTRSFLAVRFLIISTITTAFWRLISGEVSPESSAVWRCLPIIALWQSQEIQVFTPNDQH